MAKKGRGTAQTQDLQGHRPVGLPGQCGSMCLVRCGHGGHSKSLGHKPRPVVPGPGMEKDLAEFTSQMLPVLPKKSSPFGSWCQHHPPQTRCFFGRDSPAPHKPCSPCCDTRVVNYSPSLSWGRRCWGLVVGGEEHAASQWGYGWVASSFRL